MTKNQTPKSATNAPSKSGAQQINIDGTAYDLADLSDTAKQQIGNVRWVDQELAQLQRQHAIASVARNSYVQAVSASLPNDPTVPADGARTAVINGVSYDWASLGERVQGLLSGIQAANQELVRLNAQVQMAQAARATFAYVVQQNLPKRDAAK